MPDTRPTVLVLLIVALLGCGDSPESPTPPKSIVVYIEPNTTFGEAMRNTISLIQSRSKTISSFIQTQSDIIWSHRKTQISIAFPLDMSPDEPFFLYRGTITHFPPGTYQFVVGDHPIPDSGNVILYFKDTDRVIDGWPKIIHMTQDRPWGLLVDSQNDFSDPFARPLEDESD